MVSQEQKYFSMPNESDTGHSEAIVFIIYFQEKLDGL